ncbi:MAG TPA: hypothetical protein VE172_15550 [Stackebrandtia sp.]|nr:hypothetical protein [Stackebrandtia sp.]HZE40219.1 hypothetical protein [Stackebrandtia sp.]
MTLLARCGSRVRDYRGESMSDLAFVALTVVGFALLALVVRAVEKL